MFGGVRPVIKRTIEISQRPVHLTVKDQQLLIQDREGDRAVLSSAPCEDIGILLVEHPGVTYTHAALTTLLECDAAVVFCGRNHLPAGLLLPIGEHTQVVWRLHSQLAASKPLKKRLWRQIVQAKIRAQAANLPIGSLVRSRLLGMARRVRSGDPENLEAQAAKAYWATVFNQVPFHRNPDEGGVNALLNYGYAVMRAAVARAIVSAGLLPALGIKHVSRSNAFCLADDLVEPLRPMVDARVRELVRAGQTELDPSAKRGLLELLTAEVTTGDETGPLMVALHAMIASLVRCLEGDAERLEIPVRTVGPELARRGGGPT
jgi:CRISPR-associated protein Cas1